LWLDEGVAIYEQEYKDERYEQILSRALREKRVMSLEVLGRIKAADEDDAELMNLYYAQAAALVNYLIEEYGSYRFTKLCRGLRDGKSLERAWKSAYPSLGGIEQWDDKWLEYIKK